MKPILPIVYGGSESREDPRVGCRLKFNYRKIPKISPEAYIFQRPFLRALSTEGNLRFKIDWARLIVGSKFTVFALFYFAF